ncbi:unnamed protein product [Bathycoccus prasinos]
MTSLGLMWGFNGTISWSPVSHFFHEFNLRMQTSIDSEMYATCVTARMKMKILALNSMNAYEMTTKRRKSTPNFHPSV